MMAMTRKAMITALLLAMAPAIAEAQEPTRVPHNRACVIFDRSGSMIDVLDAAWQRVAVLARHHRVQPDDEMIMIALDAAPSKVYDGPAGLLAGRGRAVLNQLRVTAPARGTDVITAIELCADELNRDRAASRQILWVFSDLHIDDGPTTRFRRPADYDWTALRGVEARFFYVDPGPGGAHIRAWRQVFRAHGINAVLLDPLRSAHESYEPLSVGADGQDGAFAVSLIGAVGRGIRWMLLLVGAMLLAGVCTSVWRRVRRVRV